MTIYVEVLFEQWLLENMEFLSGLKKTNKKSVFQRTPIQTKYYSRQLLFEVFREYFYKVPFFCQYLQERTQLCLDVVKYVQNTSLLTSMQTSSKYKKIHFYVPRDVIIDILDITQTSIYTSFETPQTPQTSSKTRRCLAGCPT